MSELTPNAWAARLRPLTPARVALGHTGVSQHTRDLLDFQQAHAMARDAVHARMDAAGLAREIAAITNDEVLMLRSRAADRAMYLQRPDLGRALDGASEAALHAVRDGRNCALTMVIADGLSALAVERHAAAVLRALWPLLAGWRMAPVCVVEQGRVAIGDAIGEALGAEMCVVLIGERPGLSSPDSLGAYITWNPRAGRTDAERNCISNIRAEGLSYAQAAMQLSFYLAEARERKLTGVALKDGAHTLGEG
ncbi:MAG TPA: ethanolamine ammonia-lyase subunit EutC [Terracidiphilus sp.]|nr:ethanolamine ammonia-lyase subunit EutC [Terracidiphilus sp.]